MKLAVWKAIFIYNFNNTRLKNNPSNTIGNVLPIELLGLNYFVTLSINFEMKIIV